VGGEDMPIRVEDAKKYKGWEEDEIKIVKFLESHKGYAYTSEEIRKGLGFNIAYTPDERGSYLTPQNIAMFTLDVADRVLFEMALDRMVKERKINTAEVGGKKYYFIE
jgi:hypothetical protein